MTTPQSRFSKPNQAAYSVYCADCLCGRHFETSSCEWVCPDCARHILIDWGGGREPEGQNQSRQTDATTQEVA
jgi:hypothetical protein